MTEETWTIRYKGGPIRVRTVVQTLEDRGLKVRWEPPSEERGGINLVHEVIVPLLVSGAPNVVAAAYRKAKQRLRSGEELEIDPPLDDADGDDADADDED